MVQDNFAKNFENLIVYRNFHLIYKFTMDFTVGVKEIFNAC